LEFLSNYGLFFAKTITWVVAFIVVISFMVAMGAKRTRTDKGSVTVTKLNDEFEDLADALRVELLDEKSFKEEKKAEKKNRKKQEKEASKAKKTADAGDESDKKRVFVVDFDGDIKASAAEGLRHTVTSILSQARPQDEVVVRLESQGGMVHSYGFASSQLARIRARNIPLTICVDKVAASGGYMMACVANKILAAPFAVIGSIGVVASLPNFHRVLKKNDIDYEMLTAGEYKRTLTVLGENTEKGRQKFQQDLEETHELFKEFIIANRPQLDINKVATGEVWFGSRALDSQLIDGLSTSDEYLTGLHPAADIFLIGYETKKTLAQKMGFSSQVFADGLFNALFERLSNRYWARN
jgi:serine protease SohB